MEEFVVLVDGDDNEIGTMPKALVHQAETPLHRAFSFFLFNSKGELLLQQRSSRKKTWPLVWSNSCCGHPLPGEERKDAVKRRLKDELGLTGIEAEEAAPYRYCFTRDGVMENEICPIFIGFSDQEPVLNPEEVEAVRWVPWQSFLAEIRNKPGRYSPWCEEQVEIMAKIENIGF